LLTSENSCSASRIVHQNRSGRPSNTSHTFKVDKPTNLKQSQLFRTLKMKFSPRSVLALAANLLAIVVVVGVVAYSFDSTGKTAVVANVADVANVAALPFMPERELRHKGKGSTMSKGKGASCIALDATPAPSKGKGSSMSKGKGKSAAPVSWLSCVVLRLSLVGPRMPSPLTHADLSPTTISCCYVQSVFCSEAPSGAPSVSGAPSGVPSLSPSGSPSLSGAPSGVPSLLPSGSPSLSGAPSTSKGKGMMSTKGGKMA
jgi:hypothetical protein